jgi:hypothetical protein
MVAGYLITVYQVLRFIIINDIYNNNSSWQVGVQMDVPNCNFIHHKSDMNLTYVDKSFLPAAYTYECSHWCLLKMQQKSCEYNLD